jgi:alkanesulfonate monooxygenase SsuD/methylene tetrahydromethanopterin reductase-like flavin-dependent oxidoreductase (luciferase family)
LSSNADTSSFFSSDQVRQLSPRERVGVTIEAKDTLSALSQIKEAERARVCQAWITIGGAGRADSLTFYAAAALQTTNIRLGTSIVPVYPRHPLVTASQALAINDIAPNRLRLGIGPSHRHIMEDSYGIPMKAPLGYLLEYFEILQKALWKGEVNHIGPRFFKVKYSSQRTAQIPILISALGNQAFHLAGEISDGAISWLCPIPYLLNVALPALKAGAWTKNRARPPLVAHVLVAMTENEREATLATQKRLELYTKSPFYTRMFGKAGFHVKEDGTGPLAQELTIAGSESAIKERLLKLLASELDELLVLLVSVNDEQEERSALLRLIGSF